MKYYEYLPKDNKNIMFLIPFPRVIYLEVTPSAVQVYLTQDAWVSIDDPVSKADFIRKYTEWLEGRA